MSLMKMAILDLPPELLCRIPQNLSTIKDLLNLSSTCRTFHEICQTTRLCAGQSRIFFGPDPHFLILACSRELSAWALSHERSKFELRNAFRGGIGSLFDLCLQKCGLWMQDVRRMHDCRLSVINPLREVIDSMTGANWTSEDELWDGGIVHPATWETVPYRAAMQILIYVELFGCDMHAILHPEQQRPIFGYELRLEFIKYCIPDRSCKGGYPELEVLDVGPYSDENRSTEEDLPEDQMALTRLFRSRRWIEHWQAVVRELGPLFSGQGLKELEENEFEDVFEFANATELSGPQWRLRLWISVLIMQGIEGIEVMLNVSEHKPIDAVGDGKWRERLKALQSRVEALQSYPQVHTCGRSWWQISEAPHMHVEVDYCMRRFWL